MNEKNRPKGTKGTRPARRRGDVADSKAFAIALARTADGKKAAGIVIYDVANLIGITDYFVVCTTSNPLQMHAIAKESARQARQIGKLPRGIEGTGESGWLLTDFGDVVFHLFNRQTREYYDFDILWGDAPRIDWLPAGSRRPAHPSREPREKT